MRDYTNIDRYITELQADVYPQPPDQLQEWWTDIVLHIFMDGKTLEHDLPDGSPLPVETVLDVGCGQGQAAKNFVQRGKKWTGVTLGTDYDICKSNGLEVYEEDFSFLHFPDNSFDMIFARHALEHSPFPLLTLMEWRRVSSKYLILVLPNPEHFQYFGRNHYSVMTNSHALWLAARAGWGCLAKNYIEKQELRFLFEKSEPRQELMWESEGQLEREYGSHR